MDGIGQVFIEVINLGVKHTFTELAENKRHQRELNAIDHQLERQERIALARAGSAPTATLPAPVQPVIRPVRSASLPAPVSACRIETEVETLEMPTTAETIAELKDRLREELYDFERDMQKGMRIADKPCDCGALKHMPHIKATSRELMSYEKNPVYGQIVSWMDGHIQEFTPKEIARHDIAYYQPLAPEIRNFRKQIEE